MPRRPQRIRDPLHNLIEFEASEFESTLWRVIQTGPFQRLRRIKQLGFSDLVFPGATHSRLAHSVGVFHTARRLMTVVERHLGVARFEASKANMALAASLVHDVGHGPFSHAFEEVGRRLGLGLANHEAFSDALIRSGEVRDALNALGSGFANDVANVIKSKGPGNIYSAVVSSQFDADRLDYMRRDRLMTGTHVGEIDFEWLVSNLQVGSVSHGVDETPLPDIETFVLGPKAIHAAETYVLSLFQLYPTVYFHKATRGAEKVFTELLHRVIEICGAGDASRVGLDAAHPLVRFARSPGDLDAVLRLDDTVVWGALPMMSESQEPSVRNLSRRLRDRLLLKCVDIRERLASALGGHSSDTARFETVCASIRDRITQWLQENPAPVPRILLDQAERGAIQAVSGIQRSSQPDHDPYVTGR